MHLHDSCFRDKLSVGAHHAYFIYSSYKLSAMPVVGGMVSVARVSRKIYPKPSRSPHLQDSLLFLARSYLSFQLQRDFAYPHLTRSSLWLGEEKKIGERTRQQEISFQSKQSDKQRALHPSCCVKINHCSGLVRYSNGRSSKNVLITCIGGVLDDPQPICAVFTHESTGNVSQNITVSSVSSTVKTIAALIE